MTCSCCCFFSVVHVLNYYRRTSFSFSFEGIFRAHGGFSWRQHTHTHLLQPLLTWTQLSSSSFFSFSIEPIYISTICCYSSCNLSLWNIHALAHYFFLTNMVHLESIAWAKDICTNNEKKHCPMSFHFVCFLIRFIVLSFK